MKTFDQVLKKTFINITRFDYKETKKDVVWL